MIETIVIGYLDGMVEAIPAYAERPKEPPAEYLLIEKTGGTESNCIARATVAIQAYADTLFRAAEICSMVENAMKDIVELDEVSRCKLNTSYNYTDTESKKYRYQAVFDITFMEGEE